MPKVSRYYDVKRDTHGNRYLEVGVTGVNVLHLPLLNKSTAFTEQERQMLSLDGLLPPHISSLEEQIDRSYQQFLGCPNNLEKHIFLRNLQDRNEVLFYALFEKHLSQMMPILYTPTVSEAVQEFSTIYRYPRGVAFSVHTIGRAHNVLENVPLEDVRMIVATDSSAILGIGDQGLGGMAISIGKLSLYTVAGGVGPDKTLPVVLDVGTNRESLIDDPFYLGAKHSRLTGEAYTEFLDRFVEAVAHRYPKAIIQWEDLARGAAFEVLDRYRRVIPSFNDDIQGTGAMVLSGLLSACTLKEEAFEDQVFVVVGAGAAGIGVAWALRQGLLARGFSDAEARKRLYVVDRYGLLLSTQDLENHQVSFAHSPEDILDWSVAGQAPTLLETVQGAKATVLVGLSGQRGLFDQAAIEALAKNTVRPIVFPLSNPTDHVEVYPEDALSWTQGRAIVATGSPFEDVCFEGHTHTIGQGNNAFIFPGLGFGAILAGAREITDQMVLEAAYALAEYTASHCPGCVYPPIADIREISIKIAARVMQKAIQEGVAAEYRIRSWDLDRLEAHARERFWYPRYLPYEKV